MISIVCPYPQTDYHRPAELSGKTVRILHPQHDIRLLVCRNPRRYHIKVPQKFLGLLQLYHHDVRIRSRSQIADTVSQPAPRRHARHGAPMTDFIPARHYTVGVLRLQGAVNVLPGVLCTIVESLRRFPGLHGLVPDSQNAAVSLAVPKRRIHIINSRIDKAYHCPPPCQAQGCPLYLGDAAGNQAVGIKSPFPARLLHKAVQFGYSLVGIDIIVCIWYICLIDIYNIVQVINIQPTQVQSIRIQKLYRKFCDYIIVVIRENFIPAIHIRLSFTI